ncbi:MAG: 50S ribosomal protein L18 [Candidatus Diapherotrites archaeon]|nr:50S ribosomal protein L18 [Candidatus Diapherotrites archaeon]
MSHTSTYFVRFKRRMKGGTNYKKRLALLKGSVLRAVVRKFSNNTIVQIIEFNKIGDKTLVFCTSKELKGFGWTMHTGNSSSAYLTGYLAGLKEEKKGIKKAVLDIGLHTPVHKSRVFAALKGLIDAKIGIAHKPEVFPPENRIKGVHLKQNGIDLFEKVRLEIEKRHGDGK